MQNLAESNTSFADSQQKFCLLGAMSSSSTPTSSSNTSTESNTTTNKVNNNTTLVNNSFDNHTLEQLENFQQLLATLDPTSLQTSIHLNQLGSVVSSTSDHSTTLTNTTTAISAVQSLIKNKINVCNTSPTSTTSVTASVSNSGVETTNDYTNAATELQRQLVETLMQAGNNTNMLSSVTNNSFNNNLFGLISNSTNNNFVDWAELLLNESNANTDTKAFNNNTSVENNSVLEELGTEGLTNLLNLINMSGFNNQQWEELNATANAVFNSDNQQKVNNAALLVNSIKQQQPKYTSVAAPSSSTDRQSSTSGRSSPASNTIEQQLINLINNVTPNESLSNLSTNNISNNNFSAIAAAAGLTPSQIANAAAQIFSAVAGKNDLSNLIHNLTNNNLNLNQNNNVSNSNSDNNAAAAAVASLIAASSGSFALSRSPSKSLDSYCSICDKNLCNRYFLKTHKLKKHGISEDISIVSPIKTTINNGLFSQNNPTENVENVAKQSFRSVGSSSSSTILKNDNKNENVVNDVETDGPLAKIPKLSITSNASSSSNTAALLRQSTVPTTTTANVSLNSLNTSNSSFLNGKSTIDFLTAAEQFQKQSKIAGLSFNESIATAAALLESNNSTSSFICEICSKEFDSNLTLIQHKCAQHAAVLLSSALVSGNGSDSPQSSSSVAGSDSALNTTTTTNNNTGNNFLNSLNQLPFFLTPEMLNHFASVELDPQIVLGALSKFSSNVENALNGADQTLTGNLSSAKSSTHKRQYTSTSKNYCDLCNKEVCNKYFLRTHMLKMHQIVIDENKSVIAKIDTTEKEKSGAISFRCDVCLIELKTRQELKYHKNEVHGGLATFTNTCQSLTPSLNTQKNSLAGLSNIATSIHKISNVLLDSTKQQFYDTNASNNNSENGESENEKFVPDLLIKDKPIDDDKTNNNNNINNNNIKTSVTPQTNVEIFLNNASESHIENNDINKQEINLETDVSSVNIVENIPSSSSSTSTIETNNLSNGNCNNSTSLNIETSEHCRYCDEYFSSITKLQQHLIEEHSQEILKQFAAAAAIETSSSTDHQQLLTTLDNEEFITQVAMQMQQVNQQQQQQQANENCRSSSSVTNAAAAKLAIAKYF